MLEDGDIDPLEKIAFSGDSKWILTSRHPKQGLLGAGIDFREINGSRHLFIETGVELEPHLISSQGKWVEISPTKRLILHKIEDGIDGQRLASWVFSPKDKWFAIHKENEILLWRTDGSQTEPVSIPFTNQLTFGEDVSPQHKAWMEFPQTEDYIAVFLKADGENAIEIINLSDFHHTVLKGRWLLKYHSLSSDGKWISAGGWAIDVFLWPVSGGEPVVLGKRSLGITSVAFGPDSKWLATGSRDRSARLWSLESKDYYEFKLLNPVMKAGFSPDGVRLMASSGPTTHSWFAPTGEIQGVLSKTKNLTNALYSTTSQALEYLQPFPVVRN